MVLLTIALGMALAVTIVALAIVFQRLRRVEENLTTIVRQIALKLPFELSDD